MIKTKFISTSRTLARHPDLGAFLAAEVVHVSSTDSAGVHQAQAVLAWGRKPSASKAEAFASQYALPLWRLEDGFIHSLGQGVLGAASCSLVVDRQGIYYDATRPSELESLLEHDLDQQLTDPALLVRAGALIETITHQRISKYNNAPLDTAPLNLPPGKKVLVVDQTAGDMSLQYGLVGAEAPAQMLAAALAEHPDATILLKTHPDVLAGKKKGCLPVGVEHPRVQLIALPINPLVLLQEIEHVYVLTSQLGFEALLLGKGVTCWGLPFYAGWGLTDDRMDGAQPAVQAVLARRKTRRTVQAVFAAAYLLYTRYVHPDSGQRCELEDIVAYLSAQQRLFAENGGRLFCFGFTRWKQNYIRRFLQAPGNRLYFLWKKEAAFSQGFDNTCHIVAWGERAMQEARQLSAETGVPVWRVEDGFIRSVGLGSDYTPPFSLVLDKRGIYYDPIQVSDLEHLLLHTDFTPELRHRAQLIRESLLQNQLSKYNSGIQKVREHMVAVANRRIILVPGQVEDDASIRKGCLDIATNQALLLAVRAARPEAYIIYKPHPDVVSGNRKGRVPAGILAAASDLVLDDASITDCLEAADEVHTMTSLVGFEGLLRKKKVVCYGLPFYAGWGLTDDRHPLPRRQRLPGIDVDALVAATLILYPRYINWRTGAFTTPEFTIEILRRQLEGQGGKQKNKVNSLLRFWRKAIHICRGVFIFRY